MVVHLDRIPIDRIAAGLCMVTILAQWHSEYRCLSAPVDFRKITRACGDKVLGMLFTRRNYSMDEFHVGVGIRGQGLYDLVREAGVDLLNLIPISGRNRTLDIPRGKIF